MKKLVSIILLVVAGFFSCDEPKDVNEKFFLFRVDDKNEIHSPEKLYQHILVFKSPSYSTVVRCYCNNYQKNELVYKIWDYYCKLEVSPLFGDSEWAGRKSKVDTLFIPIINVYSIKESKK